MPTTWGYGPTQRTIEGGVDYLVKLRVPHRGEIYSINLEQIGGADDGVFEIFDAYKAARVLAEKPDPSVEFGDSSSSFSSVASEDIQGLDPPVHSVTQGKLDISGGRYRAKDLGFKYRNRDGNYTNPKRELWMVINLQGAGEKTISLSMMIEPVDLGS